MGLGRYSGAEELTDSKPSAFLEVLPANAQASCSASRTEALAFSLMVALAQRASPPPKPPSKPPAPTDQPQALHKAPAVPTAATNGKGVGS